MNQTDANRTSYDALREAIMDLSEDECSDILRAFFLAAVNPIRDVPKYK